MTTPARMTPIPRRRVAVAALGLLAVLAGLVGIGEVLRHPAPPSTAAEENIPGSDPRDELTCQEPREGQQRAEPRDDGGRAIQVSSNDLYDCPQIYDGRRVRYRGEVVGALMRRSGGVWTQLNDDAYAEGLGPLPAHRDYRGGNAGVGVLLRSESSALVEFVGGPNTRGDILAIEGVFHRVDPSGEVAVIHAEGARVAAAGKPFPHEPLSDRRWVAIVAMVLAGALTVAERWAARRR